MKFLNHVKIGFKEEKGVNGMGNSMILAETERLILRRYQKEDLQDLT